MGKVIMSGIVPQLEVPYVPIGDPVFANNDWSTIIEACQQNKVHRTWEIGDSKTMTIDGKTYTIDIIGKNHDTYSDGSGKAPLTFQMHGYYAYTKGMHTSASNSVGWTGCGMRSTTLPALLKIMPSEVKSAVKQVNKLTSAGNSSSTINTTEDGLFLLSEVEVFGTTTKSASGEGTQYDYYKAGNVTVKGAVPSYWWLRSPVISSTSQFCAVDKDGNITVGNANSSQCVAFAFCF